MGPWSARLRTACPQTRLALRRRSGALHLTHTVIITDNKHGGAFRPPFAVMAGREPVAMMGPSDPSDGASAVRHGSPAELGAEDLAHLIEEAVASGSKKALARLRRELNGDPSLVYSVDTGVTMRLQPAVWERLAELSALSLNVEDATSNCERPFMVAVDESVADAPVAVKCWVFPMGDENECVHKVDDILAARVEAPAGTQLAYGHTHPVFYGDPTAVGDYGVSRSARDRAAVDLKFWCVPVVRPCGERVVGGGNTIGIGTSVGYPHRRVLGQ
jgi:hypothetical protein